MIRGSGRVREHRCVHHSPLGLVSVWPYRSDLYLTKTKDELIIDLAQPRYHPPRWILTGQYRVGSVLRFLMVDKSVTIWDCPHIAYNCQTTPFSFLLSDAFVSVVGVVGRLMSGHRVCHTGHGARPWRATETMLQRHTPRFANELCICKTWVMTHRLRTMTAIAPNQRLTTLMVLQCCRKWVSSPSRRGWHFVEIPSRNVLYEELDLTQLFYYADTTMISLP